MKEEDLKRLIEKYYNGESTDSEEKVLRDYFRQDDISSGYEAEKVIFGYYSASERVPEPSAGFEARIFKGIDALEINRKSPGMKKYLLPLLSTAAGLLLLAGSYFFFIHRVEPKDTYSDPKIAYAETMKVLLEVSSQLNHGTQVLEPVGKITRITAKSFQSINKSTKIIEKSLKNLDNLQKAADSESVTVDKKKINKNK